MQCFDGPRDVICKGYETYETCLIVGWLTAMMQRLRLWSAVAECTMSLHRDAQFDARRGQMGRRVKALPLVLDNRRFPKMKDMEMLVCGVTV